jgi:hypothetical protein
MSAVDAEHEVALARHGGDPIQRQEVSAAESQVRQGEQPGLRRDRGLEPLQELRVGGGGHRNRDGDAVDAAGFQELPDARSSRMLLVGGDDLVAGSQAQAHADRADPFRGVARQRDIVGRGPHERRRLAAHLLQPRSQRPPHLGRRAGSQLAREAGEILEDGKGNRPERAVVEIGHLGR